VTFDRVKFSPSLFLTGLDNYSRRDELHTTQREKFILLRQVSPNIHITPLIFKLPPPLSEQLLPRQIVHKTWHNSVCFDA